MARKFRVVVNQKEYIVEVEELGATANTQIPQPTSVSVEKPLVEQPKVEKPVEKPKPVEQPQTQPVSKTPALGTGIEVKSPMAGLIVKVHVSEGQRVTRGQKLLVLEAMKMENDIVSEHDGKISKILVKQGDNVETQQTLLIIE
ncbi:MAG: biotin/lipoyl-containing protein [Pseudothermotoga sp.]